jgi:hypothetical protein
MRPSGCRPVFTVEGVTHNATTTRGKMLLELLADEVFRNRLLFKHYSIISRHFTVAHIILMACR